MVNPVSNSVAAYAGQQAQPAVHPPKAEQSSSIPEDTVSLKGAGDVDHDGDSH